VEVLLNYTFYAPSYPQRAVCEEYTHTCAAFLELLGESEGQRQRSSSASSSSPDILPVLTVHCNSTTSSRLRWETSSASTSSLYYDILTVTMANFPVSGHNQTVMKLPVLLPTPHYTSNNSNSVPNSYEYKYTLLDVVTSAGSVKISSTTSTSTGGFSVFRTGCPHGFVVPEDKSHPAVKWMAGTGCAEACRWVIDSRISSNITDERRGG
jgi:hypothetical protein